VIPVVDARRALWRRLCRWLCREPGGKDAAVVALLAVILGALALQLVTPRAGPAHREAPASLRA
jgi:hypothetical protein